MPLPERPADALGGKAFIEKIKFLPAHKREIAIVNEILRGNVPSFLRTLKPIDAKLRSGPAAGKTLRYWTLPDYLALGSDQDFVRVPLNMHSIARLNEKLDYSLPTVKMVNDIYAQASVKLLPQPIVCGRNITATSNILEHNSLVDSQLPASGFVPGTLIAGHKKDIVQSRRLIKKPKAIAIYGWHRPNEEPIQPLSTIHSAEYADYSHGVRLVSNRVEIDGETHDLREVLENRQYAAVLSNEGTIPQKAHLKSNAGLLSVASHP